MTPAERPTKRIGPAKLVDVAVALFFFVGAIRSVFSFIPAEQAQASKIDTTPHNVFVAFFIAAYVAMGVGVLARPRITYLLVAIYEAFLLFGAVATVALAPKVPAATQRFFRVDGWFCLWTALDVLILAAAVWRIRSGKGR